MSLAALVAAYVDGAASPEAEEENGRALVGALQKISRRHVQECFAARGEKAADQIRNACEAVLAGREALARWSFHAAVREHVAGLAPWIYAFAASSGAVDLAKICPVLEEGLRADHWAPDELILIAERVLDALEEVEDPSEDALRLARLTLSRAARSAHPALASLAHRAYDEISPRHWHAAGAALPLRGVPRGGVAEVWVAVVERIAGHASASPAEKAAALCDVGAIGAADLAFAALLRVADASDGEGSAKVLQALTAAAHAEPAWARAACAHLKRLPGCPPAVSLAAALHLSTVVRDHASVVAALEECLVRSGDISAKEFGIPLGSSAGARAGSDAEDFRRTVSTLAMSHADLDPALLRPLLTIGVSMIESRRSSTRDSAAVRMGSVILTECFAGQPASRQAIVATALARASVRQEDPAADQWLSLLSEICRQHPAAMIDSIQLVHAKLGELGRLPFGRAVGLLHALWPLHRLRPSFRDQLLASLRRAWATGSVETRALACRALMWLVVEELATPCEGGDESQGSKATQSQRPLGTMSQRSTLGSIPIPGVSLLHEMLAILRRAAVDEPEVSRAALRALPDVLEADATATEPVAEWLIQQVAPSAAGELPLGLSKPTLPALIRVAYIVVGNSNADRGGSGAPETAARRLAGVLDRVVDRVSAAAPEDWGVCADPGEGSDVDVCLLLACVEAAAELAVLETARRDAPRLAARTTAARARRVVALLGLHRRLALLRGCGAPDRSQDRTPTAYIRGCDDASPLSPEYVALILNGIVEDGLEPDDPDAEENDAAEACAALRALLRDGVTQIYAFERAEAVAESADRAWTSGEPDKLERALSGCPDWAEMVPAALRAARTLVLARAGSKSADALAAGVSHAALRCCRTLLALIRRGAQATPSDAALEAAQEVADLVRSLVQRDCPREAELAATALQALLPALVGSVPRPVIDALRAAATEPACKDWGPSQLRSLCEVALEAAAAAEDNSYEKLAGAIAERVAASLAAADDADSSEDRRFQPKSAAALATLLLSSLGARLGRLEALHDDVTRLDGASHQAALERWCGSMVRLAYPFASLAECPMQGSSSDSLLKSSIKIYRALGAMAKCEISRAKGCPNLPPLSPPVVRAVSWVNSTMTPAMHSMIEEVEGEVENVHPAPLRKRSLTTRLKRQGRLVPDLVFAIENYERLLLRLSRGGRLDPAVAARGSVSRDIRIRLA